MSAAGEDADDLQDARLRRALAHAPDHNAVPDWRLRKAILREAHEAVGVAELAARDVSSPPWWRRILFGSGQGSRMPWNAAFATVLVATLVTVLWQREPVPGARLDGEVSSAVPSSPLPAPTTVPTPGPEREPAQAAAPEPPAASPTPAFPDAPASPGDGSAPAAAAPPEAPAPSPPSESVAQPVPEPPPPLVFQRAPEAPPVEAPRRSERRRADDSVSAAPRASERFEAEKTEKKAAPAAPPAAPVAPAPPPVSTGSAAPDASAGLGASSSAANAARAARPAATPSERTAFTEPPTFAALSQWNRVTITQRGGGGKSLTRAEAGDLGPLLGSAAISAVGPKPLAGVPEWRVTLERDGQTLAVFDIGRNQVRWREGNAPPATGAPSAPALAALGEALRDAVQPPPEPDAAAEPPRNP